ncbi:hypothetical protein [Sporosarcina sp. FSL K6-2383]|uniref:hypothetical protein n=1 Tax=Sporosarcina sp. FSL K6-2383 TaxID=2921556 RepID=UPI00315B3339
MVRNCCRLITFAVLLFVGLFVANPAEASSPITGKFVKVTYEDVYIDEDNTEKRLTSITIENNQGQTTTLNIDKFANLSVDTITTTIDAFKLGMEVEADVNLRRVKALRGKTGALPGKIENRDKVLMGTVLFINNRNTTISFQLDNGEVNSYIANHKTSFFNGKTMVDSSTLYEGDRVKLTFAEYNTKFIDSIEIITEGVKVENIYRGSLQQIDSSRNQLLLNNEEILLNGRWRLTGNGRNTAYAYSSDTSIYVGNQAIKRDELRYYRNHVVYFVTVSQFGQEVIKKIIIKKGTESSYTEPIQRLNNNLSQLTLKTAGSLSYHSGTIFIRNGRLVDSKSLRLGDTAFVVAETNNVNRSANIVNLSNDGFMNSSLTGHSVYFGQIDTTNGYQLKLKNTKSLTQHTWKNTTAPTLSFANDTVVTEDYGSSTRRLNARDELRNNTGRYGYFYVKDKSIVGVHLVGYSNQPAPYVSIGQYDSRYSYSPDIISIRNVSRWGHNSFNSTNTRLNLNVNQATFIRNGRIISVNDLRQGDQLYILHEYSTSGKIIFVN